MLSTIAFSLFAALTLAAPTPDYPATAGNQMAQIVLIDATQHEYPVTLPMSDVPFNTNVEQSISHVRINNAGKVPCTFYGINGVEITSMPGEVTEMDVGPPQVIVSGKCGWEGY